MQRTLCVYFPVGENSITKVSGLLEEQQRNFVEIKKINREWIEKDKLNVATVSVISCHLIYIQIEDNGIKTL